MFLHYQMHKKSEHILESIQIGLNQGPLESNRCLFLSFPRGTFLTDWYQLDIMIMSTIIITSANFCTYVVPYVKSHFLIGMLCKQYKCESITRFTGDNMTSYLSNDSDWCMLIKLKLSLKGCVTLYLSM